jgi:hypothetical protein
MYIAYLHNCLTYITTYSYSIYRYVSYLIT